MGNEVKKNASEPWNKTPFWNLGWALESGSHPLAYLQSPVGNRWRPPLSSFRSSGHTDPEQPGAWVLQRALLERFSRLVTKWEKRTDAQPGCWLKSSFQTPASRKVPASLLCPYPALSLGKGLPREPLAAAPSLLLRLITSISTAAATLRALPSTHRTARKPGRVSAGGRRMN